MKKYLTMDQFDLISVIRFEVRIKS